jgi:uncharacterized protein YkwD
MGRVTRWQWNRGGLCKLVLGVALAAGLATPACVTIVPGGPPGPGTSEAPLDPAAAAADLVAAHNRVRSAHGLPPLDLSEPLQAAALEHAQDMARRRSMSHRGGDGSSPFRCMASQGYAFRRAGENVAAGYGSVEAVMKGWMWSPGHRWNILGRFSEIGAACATATDGTLYWCVTFGEPAAP